MEAAEHLILETYPSLLERKNRAQAESLLKYLDQLLLSFII